MKRKDKAIYIILLGTTHPGNIGAAARAMKTMGQTHLRLVAPKYFPATEATKRATQAQDILDNAAVFNDLEEAVADCDLVVGTSARSRRIPWPTLSPRELSQKLVSANHTAVAIVFGQERSGLSNDELALCNLILQIPTTESYHSLNLAAAVQIICYELFVMEQTHNVKNNIDPITPVKQIEMEQFYQHLEQSLSHIGFLDQNNPGKLMHRLRRLFNRAQLEDSEWKILRGILARVDTLKK